MDKKTEDAGIIWEKLADVRRHLRDSTLQEDSDFNTISDGLEILMIRLCGKFDTRDLAEVLNKEVP
jgi:hypothetical protein